MIVFLEIGGNQGAVLKNMETAIQQIANAAGSVVAVSNVYKSPPWGFEAKDYFFNQVVKIKTPLKPVLLLQKLQEIEQGLGRVRGKEQFCSRTMDIDILLIENQVINSPVLQVPHPRMHERNFVLYPLAELNGEYLHPVLNQSIAELKVNCIDNSLVEVI